MVETESKRMARRPAAQSCIRIWASSDGDPCRDPPPDNGPAPPKPLGRREIQQGKSPQSPGGPCSPGRIGDGRPPTSGELLEDADAVVPMRACNAFHHACQEHLERGPWNQPRRPPISAKPSRIIPAWRFRALTDGHPADTRWEVGRPGVRRDPRAHPILPDPPESKTLGPSSAIPSRRPEMLLEVNLF